MENEKDNLYSVISGITELDKNIINEAKKRVDSLAKPLGSLGKLEDIALKLAGITGKVKNKIKKKCIIIMAADNGVVEEGVASAPQSVTLAQTINFSRGITGVAALSKENNTDLMVVDIGVNTNKKILGAIDRKIRRGTSNIINGPAMSYDEAIRAINIGIEMAKKAYENGYDIEIIEKHHNQKIDAPSGTAKLLYDVIHEDIEETEEVYDRSTVHHKREKNEVGIQSVRAGTIFGEHSVLFAGHDEIIEVKHTALSKDVFVQGALAAAKALQDKEAGLFTLKTLY